MKFDSFYSDEMYELTERNILSVFKAVVDKDKTRMYGINLINEKYKGPGMEEVPPYFSYNLHTLNLNGI